MAIRLRSGSRNRGSITGRAEIYFLFHIVQSGSGTHSSVHIYRQAERPGFDSRQGKKTFLRGVHTPGALRPWRETDHAPPSNAEIKYCGAIPPLPTRLMVWRLIN
jgi:hypothetical protein